MPFANALFRNYFSSAFTRTNSNKIGKFSMEIGKNSDIKMRMTAGIIVIGDEILKGSTVDSNSHFLCQHLYNRGVLVKKISVIGDHVAEIAKEVRQFSGAFDIVFTTGGIGPTHDDRTFEGLAAAFNEQLATSEELLKIAQIFMRKTNLKNIDDSVDKFCRLPESATLLWGSQKPPANPSELVAFPSVRIRNVIALPGVPQFCEQSFELLEDHLFPSAKMASFFSKNIYLHKNELHLQQKLAQIAEKYSPNGVTIGSYPVVGHSYFKTRLSIDSEDIGMGKSAFEELQREFSEWIAEFDERPWENCAEKLEKFGHNQPKEFADKIDEAMKTINEILKKYSLDQIALSFNGGKDCTLLLHLFRAAIDSKYGKETQIRGFFIEGDDEFGEVVEFVRNISKRYNLSMWELKGGQKAGLAQLKKEQPKIVAVLMGSRSTDPMGKFMKTKVEWTDADWPTFLRVCPLLDWRYSQIWLGLRGLCIPYCPLYDQGYSSLGERSKTAKNPHLRLEGNGDRYQPAYLLKEENLERAFREERPEGE